MCRICVLFLLWSSLETPPKKTQIPVPQNAKWAVNESPNQIVIHHIQLVNKSGAPFLQLPSYDQGRLLEGALNYGANRGGCILASRQRVYTCTELQINLTINLTNRPRERKRGHCCTLRQSHIHTHGPRHFCASHMVIYGSIRHNKLYFNEVLNTVCRKCLTQIFLMTL